MAPRCYVSSTTRRQSLRRPRMSCPRRKRRSGCDVCSGSSENCVVLISVLRFKTHLCLLMSCGTRCVCRLIYRSLFRRMSSVSCGLPDLRVIWACEELLAYLHPCPWTPGVAVVTQKTPGSPDSVFHLPEHSFLRLLLGARTVAKLLCEQLDVRRCALLHAPYSRAGKLGTELMVIPLHGVTNPWKAHTAAEEDFQPYDPGYITSKSGPRWTDSALEEMKSRIRARLPRPHTALNFTYFGQASDLRLFPRIVRGEEKQWRVWEDDSHIAFLTPYPNTPGLTVLTPRKPLSSDIFCLEEDDYKKLVLAARQVSRLLEAGLEAWGVGLIFEGLEINYAHAKLIPLVSCPDEAQMSLSGPASEFHQLYPGYVASVNGPPAGKESLQRFCAKITQR